MRTGKRMKKAKNKYSVWNNIYFFYRKLYEFKPSVIWLMVASVVFGVIAPLFTIYIPKVLLDLVTGKVAMAKFALVFGGMILAYIGFSAAASYVDHRKYFDMNIHRNYLMYFLFRKSLKVTYKNAESGAYREKYWSGIHQLCGGDWSISSILFRVLPQLAILVLNFCIYSMVIGSLSPLIIILLITISLLNYSIFEWERKQWRKIQPAMDDLNKKLNYINVSAGGSGGSDSTAKDMRIFGLDSWIHGKQEQLIAEMKAYETQHKKWVFIRENVGYVLGLLRDAIAYIYLIIQTAKGSITPGDFVLYLGAIVGFSNFVNGIIGSVQEILSASDRSQNYREYYDLEDEKVEEGTVSIEDLRYPLDIEFKNVSFAYEEGKDVLSNLNFHIKAGEKIAIVGVNGAGKTTIVKLLCGFYEPTKGEIKINGINSKEFAKKDLYKLFSTVFQDNRCFPFTVGENLTFQKQGEIDEAKAYSALEQAGILKKFKERKIGLNDYMTHYFLKDGVVLSGGEMQRFMLARAIYKDAPILVLDEPTAALDPIAESEIYSEYAKMSEGKSSIFISHRLASTRFSDKILFLKDGRIAESGSHEELMEMNGDYANMFEVQASYYKETEE